MAQTTGIQLLDDTLVLLERAFGITMDPTRVRRIADEIRRGERSASGARSDIIQYVVGEDRVAQWVEEQFTSRGLDVGTSREPAADRVARITGELMGGSRTFSDLRSVLDTYSSPTTGGGAGGGGTGGGGGGGAGGGGVAIPPGDSTAYQRDAIASINETLARYGLPSSLGDWVWNQVIVNGMSEAEVLLALRDRDEFKERFPAIADGVPVSPAQYVEYEQQALALFQQSGLPGAFFDDPGEFQDIVSDLLTNNVALPELNQRLNQTFVDVDNAPPEVRDAFAEFFMDGEMGDMALAAFILDPDLALPKLERMVQTAQVAGAGARFDFDISESFAARAAELGITRASATERFGRASRLRPLTGGLFGERTTFDTDSLLGATVMDDARAVDSLRRRQEGRVGTFQGGTQGVTEEGVTGLGTADDL